MISNSITPLIWKYNSGKSDIVTKFNSYFNFVKVSFYLLDCIFYINLLMILDPSILIVIKYYFNTNCGAIQIIFP